MEITREQLAKALDGFGIDIKDGTFLAAGLVDRPQETASALWARLASEAARGDDRDVVDASICCDHDHLPDDRELALMAAILSGMRWLDKDARHRIRQWVDERFANTPPPF